MSLANWMCRPSRLLSLNPVLGAGDAAGLRRPRGELEPRNGGVALHRRPEPRTVDARHEGGGH